MTYQRAPRASSHQARDPGEQGTICPVVEQETICPSHRCLSKYSSLLAATPCLVMDSADRNTLLYKLLPAVATSSSIWCMPVDMCSQSFRLSYVYTSALTAGNCHREKVSLPTSTSLLLAHPLRRTKSSHHASPYSGCYAPAGPLGVC
jgi:hypothetical protein